MQRVISRGLQPDESTISNEQFEIVVADLGNFRIQVLSENGEFLRHLSLLGSNQQIAFQRDQLNGLYTTLLREFATLKDLSPLSLSGSNMTQLYTLAAQLYPSSPAFTRIAAAQSQWREIRARFHHPLAITYAPVERELVFVDHDNATVFIYNADGSRSKWLELSREKSASGVTSVHSVLQLSISSGTKSTSGGGEAQDRLYVSDPQSHRIPVFDSKSHHLLFFIGASTYGDETQCSPGFCPGELHHPSFLAHFTRRTADSSITTQHLVVSDSGNHSISLFDAWSGAFCERVGRGFGHLDGYMDSPQGVAVLEDRWLYVCDQRNHRIQVFDLLDTGDKGDEDDGSNGRFVRTFGRFGHAPGEFSFPTAVAICPALPQVDSKCNLGAHREAKVVVGDTGNHRVQVFCADDTFQLLLLLDVHLTPFDQPFVPMGVYVDPRSGSILTADAANQCVLVFRRDGVFLSSFGSTVEPENRFERPTSIAFFHSTTKANSDGNGALNGQLLVTDAGRSDVCVFELRQEL